MTVIDITGDHNKNKELLSLYKVSYTTDLSLRVSNILVKKRQVNYVYKNILKLKIKSVFQCSGTNQTVTHSVNLHRVFRRPKGSLIFEGTVTSEVKVNVQTCKKKKIKNSPLRQNLITNGFYLLSCLVFR